MSGTSEGRNKKDIVSLHSDDVGPRDQKAIAHICGTWPLACTNKCKTATTPMVGYTPKPVTTSPNNVQSMETK